MSPTEFADFSLEFALAWCSGFDVKAKFVLAVLRTWLIVDAATSYLAAVRIQLPMPRFRSAAVPFAAEIFQGTPEVPIRRLAQEMLTM